MEKNFKVVKFLTIFIYSACFIISTRDGLRVGGKLISVSLANSVCSQHEQFKQTQEIQPVEKSPPNSNSNLPANLPCGWFPLKSCENSQQSQLCSFSKPRFLTCDKVKTRKTSKSGRTFATPPKRQENTEYRTIDSEWETFYPAFKYLSSGFLEKKSFSTRKREVNGTLLPRSVTPRHYDLFVRPILQETKGPEEPWVYLTCPGSVRILLDLNNETNRISVHRAETMTIDYVKVTQTSNDEEVPIAQQTYNNTEQLEQIDLERALSDLGEGTYELLINFTAEILNDPSKPSRGLFAGNYEDDSGQIKNFAVTQFQTLYARRAFPCFDQPQFKSTYSVSIARTAGYSSRSNGQIVETVEDPEHSGWFIDRFEKTLTMVSYLVAYLISDFTCETAAPSIFNKPVQMCGQPNLINQGIAKFQANVSAHMISGFESTYKFPYEMSKVDQVAVPEIHKMSGMEHWGLITYRDTHVLTFEEEPSQAGLSVILAITSHELAHMWFGNLVTCLLWEDLWLNEGISTFAERIQHKTNPDFYSGTHIEPCLLATTLDVDERTPISGPDSELTVLIYVKGSALLVWSASIFGEDLFTEALVDYLQKYAYQSVVTDDFLAVLDEFALKGSGLQSGKTMKEFLDGFLLQPGHPLLRVQVESGGGSGTTTSTTISLTQEKYQLVESDQKYDNLWEFPIKYISDENPSIDNGLPDLWMSGHKITTSITIGPESWYIFNADGLGFYRVLYDDQLFDLLLTQLEKDHTVINFNARCRLIFDYLSFLERGVASLEQTFSLTKYMNSEVDPVVWKTLFAGIGFMEKLMISRKEYKDYWTPRLENLINHLDIKKQGQQGFNAIFKAAVFKKAAKLRIPSFVEHSSTLVQNWAASATTNSKPPIQVDYRLPIFYAAVVDAENSLFEVIFQIFKDNPRLTDLFVALGCSENLDQVQTVLNYSLEDTSVGGTSAYLLYTEVASNELMGSLLLQFLDQRFTEVVDKIFMFKLVYLTKFLSTFVVNEETRDKMLEFVEKHGKEFGDAVDELTGAIKHNFNSNEKFMKELVPPALKWFKENS